MITAPILPEQKTATTGPSSNRLGAGPRAFSAGRHSGSCEAPVYRIQDREGRGPWRPGFSHRWASAVGPALPPPIIFELPNFEEIARAAHRRGLHIGCAVRGLSGFSKWILSEEMSRLKALKFRIVRCTGCEVLAETEHQLLVGSSAPLHLLPRVSFSTLNSSLTSSQASNRPAMAILLPAVAGRNSSWVA